MLKTGKRLKHKRSYSEEFKRKIVEDFEKGNMNVHEMERYYGVSNQLGLICNVTVFYFGPPRNYR